ncbi:MAG: hypothetical protein AABO58_16245 [Acidobacteriota bacterium]
MRTTLAVLASLAVFPLAAQPLTVGTMPPDPLVSSSLTSGAPATFVNLASYATANGTVNRAAVQWSTACTGAFKIVFLRNNLSSTSAFTVVATRGPFNAVRGRNDVTLTPPVTVAQYDLIGVVQMQPIAACGSVQAQDDFSGGTGYRLITTSDMSISGALGPNVNLFSGDVMGLIAYNSNPLLVRVLPAAGAVQGVTAFFRTAVQLYNPTPTVITGKLIFHKAGQPAAAGDPSLAFTLNPDQVVSYPDLVASMGTSGLGSLDIVTDGGAVPIINARVFSDGGSAGTSGFTEEAVAPNDTLYLFNRGFLVTPTDPVNFRMNIGVRTLDAGATLSIRMYNADGLQLSTRTGVAFAPNYFEQFTAQQFTGAAVIPSGGFIRINVTAGNAIVYGTITDNRTSDSSMQYAAH